MQLAGFVATSWPLAVATGTMAIAAALASAGGAGGSPVRLGVAPYPGAMLVGPARRVDTPEAATVGATYASLDSVERVAAFYRDALRATSSRQQLFDDRSSGGVSLMLSNGPQQRSVTVDIDPVGWGSSIHIRARLPHVRSPPRCIARSGVCSAPSG